jgi:hypothetical protein
LDDHTFLLFKTAALPKGQVIRITPFRMDGHGCVSNRACGLGDVGNRCEPRLPQKRNSVPFIPRLGLGTYFYGIDGITRPGYHRPPSKEVSMPRFLICINPDCRFVLDRRLNGASLDGVQKILKTCPACHTDWSSLCPFCDHTLDVTFVAGRPVSACCGHTLRPETTSASPGSTALPLSATA